MKISDLKRVLQKISKRHGDIECVMLDGAHLDQVTVVADTVAVMNEAGEKIGEQTMLHFMGPTMFNSLVAKDSEGKDHLLEASNVVK